MVLAERADVMNADRAVDWDPAPAPRGALRYEPLLPEPVAPCADGPTGLLALTDNPSRLGLVHGALAGLAYPSINGTAEEFVAQFGPDGLLTAESRTAVLLRERAGWIENAHRKANEASDRAAVGSALIEARRQAAEAEATAAPVVMDHKLWRGAFKAASDPARRTARILRWLAGAGFAWWMATGIVSGILWFLAAFLIVGISARLLFRLRFRRGAADAIKLPIHAERTRSLGLRVVEMHRRGLASD